MLSSDSHPFEKFLSTPSVRRATRDDKPTPAWSFDFYPRPPRGGRLQHSGPSDCAGNISIHALREEGDEQVQRYIDVGKKFLSTPSARRATRCSSCSKRRAAISIHALREEGD